MFNPHSAIDRIKNQLAYKLGFAIIEHKNYGGGYISLIYKLYKIKKEHFLQRKIYKQTIQVFPHLTYPKLENCKDYNQALVYKLHLSYMIGTVLIQADKNKFKGGYFSLYKDIKQVRLFYNTLKDFKENKNIPMKAFDILYKNINLISLEKIKEISFICDLHKDYIPILDNIYQNFEFVLKNIELIKEWLISDDFNQKYKKTNHPYPSLLDPRKLNDTNEKINYNNIPAELAWNMNLPLMGKFKFILMTSPSCGT
ncbi:sugar transferase, partial [Campylobacter lari]|nr:sugar transferase [Campylobacter lari]